MEDLQRRFRLRKPPRPARVAPAVVAGTDKPAAVVPEAPNEPKRPVTGQDRAERTILGILLAEPQRWFEVQQHVMLDDFAGPQTRKLAELYWGHQRDEGEPVFSEFLGTLEPAGLGALAVELLEEAERMGDVEMALAGAVGHLHEVRRLKEEQKQLAALRRTKDEKVSEEEEIARLREFARPNQPSLHRLGPVRRFGS